MHFSDMIGNLGTKIYFFFWSMNYSNLVFKVFIAFWKWQDTRTLFIVYIGKYLVLAYIERLLFIAFLLYLLVSKLPQLSKFYKFFLTCFKTVGKIIFEGFKYCPSWKAPFQLSGTFLSFFIWSVSCSLFFFQTHSWPLKCMS